MFLSCRSPRSSNVRSSLPAASSWTSGRYTDPAWVCQAFEPRRDIHAISENVVILDDDVALVDSNTKFDAVFSRVSISLGHALLPFGCAAQRIHDAGELNEKSVSGGLYQPAFVLGISPANDWNNAYYGKNVLPPDILVRSDTRNPQGEQLAADISRAATIR